MSAPTAAPVRAHDPWAPFRHRVYLVIWTATVVSNVGSWMYNAAAAWLMTGLSADPMMVSLVQVASNLPIFLFALPAGAIADVVDKRRFLLIAETSYALVAVVFAALVTANLVTPLILLAFVFVLGAGTAIMAPPYQSIVPLLVPRHDLAPAVAANSVGMNISRAVGPALGGIITAAAGIAAPFWVNAFSNMGTIGALWWWKPPRHPASTLPSERLFGAMRTGIRYARFNAALRATFARAAAFFLFASAYWALLPLVARDQVAGGATSTGSCWARSVLARSQGLSPCPACAARSAPIGWLPPDPSAPRSASCFLACRVAPRRPWWPACSQVPRGSRRLPASTYQPRRHCRDG